MLQGTGSDVGKSLLVAGLCRAYTRRGLRVRPFKPQNMSNNAAVTADGGEIGRAQALQARACGAPASRDMNPVLLKPQTDEGSQVVVQGEVWRNARAREYHRLKAGLLPRILESFERLGRDADLVLVEGAGSPAEVNLRAGDVANMGFAEAADVTVALVGDIDRGGVIASLVGTMALLSASERARVGACIINRFRGDVRLFDSGIEVIRRRTGLPCLGVVPWFEAASRLPAEDSVSVGRNAGTRHLEARYSEARHDATLAEARRPEARHDAALAEARYSEARHGAALAETRCPEARHGATLAETRHLEAGHGAALADARYWEAQRLEAPRYPEIGYPEARPGAPLQVAVPVLSRIANFDDLDPLVAEPGVEVRFVAPGRALPGDADLVVLPGSKATIGDMRFLRSQGWDVDIRAHLRRGGWLLGLCGGYQMLGRTIRDPGGIEGEPGVEPGLGLLDLDTELAGAKQLAEVRGTDRSTGQPVRGYEMHVGATTGPATSAPMLDLDGRRDGAVSADGKVMGCYLHGLFASDAFRAAFLERLGGRAASGLAWERQIDATLDALAEHLESSLDLDAILRMSRRGSARVSATRAPAVT